MDAVVASTTSPESTGRQPKRGAAETTNDPGRFDDESRCYSVIITVARDSARMTVIRRERGPSSSPWQKGLIVNRESRVRIGVSPDHPTTNLADHGAPGPRSAAHDDAADEWRTGVSCRQELDMDLQCTAVFRKVPEGYIAFIEEFPGANTQGASLDEARTNLREAVALVVEANRMLAREDAADGAVIREPLTVTE